MSSRIAEGFHRPIKRHGDRVRLRPRVYPVVTYLGHGIASDIWIVDVVLNRAPNMLSTNKIHGGLAVMEVASEGLPAKLLARTPSREVLGELEPVAVHVDSAFPSL